MGIPLPHTLGYRTFLNPEILEYMIHGMLPGKYIYLEAKVRNQPEDSPRFFKEYCKSKLRML